jgi:mono/diheme cytochrome c family protein
MIRLLLTLPLLWLPLASAAAQVPAAQPGGAASNALPTPRTGEDIYKAACITCHGPDGTGSSKTVVGFDAELPDFTDCAFSSGEADLDWYSVVHEGSPIRGLGHHMPAFGDALSTEDIELVVSHVRTFCTDSRWPRGDLNLPRAFFTEKAFPENETVWSTAIVGTGEKAVLNKLVYERRFGPRTQLEAVIPINFEQIEQGHWSRKGIGDVALGVKRVLAASMESGAIVSAGAEIILPTGKEFYGMGNGHVVFEPFAMWGKLLPRNFFVQMHGGVELPFDTEEGRRETFLRTAIGTSFFSDRGFGRAWSPTVEVLWAKPEDALSEWDLVPQIQVSLSKLQHVMVAGGVRIPIRERVAANPFGTRPVQVLVYLLWDWYDGGFFDFWK